MIYFSIDNITGVDFGVVFVKKKRGVAAWTGVGCILFCSSLSSAPYKVEFEDLFFIRTQGGNYPFHLDSVAHCEVYAEKDDNYRLFTLNPKQTPGCDILDFSVFILESECLSKGGGRARETPIKIENGVVSVDVTPTQDKCALLSQVESSNDVVNQAPDRPTYHVQVYAGSAYPTVLPVCDGLTFEVHQSDSFYFMYVTGLYSLSESNKIHARLKPCGIQSWSKPSTFSTDQSMIRLRSQ
ncbi:hypothetical protein [Vibrio sp. F13]|uniref:hypothetical protein n=1 Tax=Vibrio sp. F13 TaxID=2070777 RepID=UPI0010BDE324|nr:hypothetical protein [Vibrio sp. F13]TKG09035.1 hypothetical protein FCV67_07955 [Vibrio sp. F13]